MQIAYTAEATSRGEGRNGEVTSSDGVIDEQVRVPVELGGAGNGTNPEQLFAAGYAACFHNALRRAATERGVTVPAEGTVTARVGIGPDGTGFGMPARRRAGRHRHGDHVPGSDPSRRPWR